VVKEQIHQHVRDNRRVSFNITVSEASNSHTNKKSVRLKSQIGLQLWTTWILMKWWWWWWWWWWRRRRGCQYGFGNIRKI